MIEVRNGRTILTTPVSESDLARLRIGDVFYLDGELATGRDSVHERTVYEGKDLPVDIRDKVLMHAGPIVKQTEVGGREMISIGPTTSMRMEKYEYDLVKATGVRVIVGKGGMGPSTAAACRDFGAIHCVMPAGNAVVGAVCTEEILGGHWLDLGMPEAVWHCRVRELGPLIVTIDTSGRNYFEEKKTEYDRIRREQTELISKQVHFTK